MPVGMPQVEYQLPGNPDPEFINIMQALYRERMLFLCQEIEDTIANELIGLMLYLNAEDPSRDLFLYINSPGGSVTCGLGIYDMMRYVNSGITTICMGGAASMASFLLAGGTSGRRIAMPSSRIMIHQPEGGSDGQATESIMESTEVKRIRRQVGLIYANRTGQSVERIAEDLDRDQFLSAYEAQAYGLVDYVAILNKPGFRTRYEHLVGLENEVKDPGMAKLIRQLLILFPPEWYPGENPYDLNRPTPDMSPEARATRRVPLPVLFYPPTDESPPFEGTDLDVDVTDFSRVEACPTIDVDLPDPFDPEMAVFRAVYFGELPEIIKGPKAWKMYLTSRLGLDKQYGLDEALGCVEAIFGLSIDLDQPKRDVPSIKEYLRNPDISNPLPLPRLEREVPLKEDLVTDLQEESNKEEKRFKRALRRYSTEVLPPDPLVEFPVPAADLARKLIFARRQRAAFAAKAGEA